MVWEDKILDHLVNIQKPHFTIDSKDPSNCNIQVLKTDNKFLNYLINSIKIYWREDLEKPFSTDEAGLKDKDLYYQSNQFNIAGKNLSKDQVQEQMQHLCNKIYALGYFLHKYKDDSNAFFVYAMDHKISELDESHGGGSGKSATLAISTALA